MDIKALFNTNVLRSTRWHEGDIKRWSTLEWAGAACGEAGEMANAAKKLKRLEDGIQSKNDEGRNYVNIQEAQEKVVKEACDTILYTLLVVARTGCTSIQFEDTLKDVFNAKSREYNFPERI